MKRIAMSINNASNGLQKVRKVPVEDLRIVGKPFECFSTVCRGTQGLFTSLPAAETFNSVEVFLGSITKTSSRSPPAYDLGICSRD